MSIKLYNTVDNHNTCTLNETTAICLHTIHKALLSLIMTEGKMYERLIMFRMVIW